VVENQNVGGNVIGTGDTANGDVGGQGENVGGNEDIGRSVGGKEGAKIIGQKVDDPTRVGLAPDECDHIQGIGRVGEGP
jgi:hypothetical protein